MSGSKIAVTMLVAILFCTATSVLAQDDPFAIIQKLGFTLPPGGVGEFLADPKMAEMAKAQAESMGLGDQLAKGAEALKQGESVESLAQKAMQQAQPEQVAQIAAKAQSEAAKLNITVPKDVDTDALKSKIEETVKATIPPNIMQAAEDAKAAMTTEKPATKPAVVTKAPTKAPPKKKTKKPAKAAKKGDSKKATAAPKKKSG